MSFSLRNLSFLATLGAVWSLASAAPVPIAGVPPDFSSGSVAGERVDQTGDPRHVDFSGLGIIGYKITTIEWWGYDLDPVAEPLFDVTLNSASLRVNATVGAELVDTFSSLSGDVEVYRYYLDLSAQDLRVEANNQLSLRNTFDSVDAEWYWIYANGSNLPLSFRVYGEQTTQIPEPSSAYLATVASLGLLLTRRRRA
jgi:hypothetical protein